MIDDDETLREYTVELDVTGTWRERLIARSPEEAERHAKRHIREQLTGGDMSWGDLGWRLVAVGADDDE